MRRHATNVPWLGLLAVVGGAIPAAAVPFVLAWTTWDRLFADEILDVGGTSTGMAVLIALVFTLGGFAFYLTHASREHSRNGVLDRMRANQCGWTNCSRTVSYEP